MSNMAKTDQDPPVWACIFLGVAFVAALWGSYHWGYDNGKLSGYQEANQMWHANLPDCGMNGRWWYPRPDGRCYVSDASN